MRTNGCRRSESRQAFRQGWDGMDGGVWCWGGCVTLTLLSPKPLRNSNCIIRVMVKSRAGSANGRLPNVAQKQNLQSVPLLQQDVFQVDGVLSELEAARFIETAERLGLEHQGSRGAAHGEAHRDNERVAFQDEAFAKHLWQMSGLADVFRQMDLDNQTAIGVNPNIRLYKYGPGQSFGKHVDDSVDVGDGMYTEYTLLIYLSGSGSPAAKGKQKGVTKSSPGLLGGDTIFYGHRGKVVATVVPKAGRALLHRHGDACLEHESAPVKAGLKYILRSDVCFTDS